MCRLKYNSWGPGNQHGIVWAPQGVPQAWLFSLPWVVTTHLIRPHVLTPGTRPPCKLLVNECWRVVRVWQGLSCSIYNHVDILHSLFCKNTDLNKKSDTVTSGARNQNFLSYMLSLPCQTNHYSPLLKASQILSLESKVKLTNIFPLHLTRGCEM